VRQNFDRRTSARTLFDLDLNWLNVISAKRLLCPICDVLVVGTTVRRKCDKTLIVSRNSVAKKCAGHAVHGMGVTGMRNALRSGVTNLSDRTP
jgi:hypothetical protein